MDAIIYQKIDYKFIEFDFILIFSKNNFNIHLKLHESKYYEIDT